MRSTRKQGGKPPTGESHKLLNHQGEDHHTLDPHPHPHLHHVVDDEQRVAEVPSQKFVAF